MSLHIFQDISACSKRYSVTKSRVGTQEMHNLAIRLANTCNMYFTMQLKVGKCSFKAKTGY